MALSGCVGARAHDALITAIDEAIKENAIDRLLKLLDEGNAGISAINHKHLLHQAAWLGHTNCVRILLSQGADPDRCHRKNGCTPLHLAHFCTIEETNPKQTIHELISAGASVNNPGSSKCGKAPLDHALHHQRLDSVQALLNGGSLVPLPSILLCIDVANPQILELLLINGGQCGKLLDNTVFWGQPLHRVLYAPLKSPRECYKQTFHLLVQATVCRPIHGTHPMPLGQDPLKKASNHHQLIETELKNLAKAYVDLTQYLFAFMVRNGFWPNESIKQYMKTICTVEWLDRYLSSPPTLRDLAVRITRSCLYLSGNITNGTNKLSMPNRIKNIILMINPL